MTKDETIYIQELEAKVERLESRGIEDMQARIAELELINQNYRLGGQHKQEDWLELIDKCERLDAALADADWLALKISEGNFNQAEVIKKSREFLKARGSDG